MIIDDINLNDIPVPGYNFSLSAQGRASNAKWQLAGTFVGCAPPAGVVLMEHDVAR